VHPKLSVAGYSGTPLPKKLGIKPGAVVALVDAPTGFEQTLGELPAGVRLRRDARGRAHLTLCFVRTRAELGRRIPALSRAAAQGGLWICWPKKASGVATDLSDSVVRKVGLAAGLVDFKVCAVDATWSGLRFASRKTKSPGRGQEMSR
jgi:hypothetical protein